MTGDWLKLHRGIRYSDVLSDPHLCQLWVWCLVCANYREKVFKGQKLKPGQFVTGRNKGAEELHVSPSKFYRGLHKLEEMGNVRLEVNSRWTTVTICKWGTYQSEESESEQQVNSNRTASEQQVNTTKEGKKVKNVKKEDNLFAAAAAEGPDTEPLAETPDTPEPTPTPPPTGTTPSAGLKGSKPPRPRDELFDTLVDMTGSDPRVNASHLGRVLKVLRSADPPYTPDDVRRLPSAAAEAGMPSFPMTLGAVEKHIGLVRRKPVRTNEPPPRTPASGHAPQETIAEKVARVARERAGEEPK